jgi:hypothetical protein
MVRSRYSILFLLFIAVCGLGVALAGSLFQPAKAAEKGSQLNEWKFPGAESQRMGNPGNGLVAADYVTSKSFEEVWAYYAKKIGYEKEYRPNLTYGGGTGQYLIQILNSTDESAAGKARRPSTKSATLIRRGAGESVTVFVSRAKDEDKTYFTLIVEEK